MSPRQFFSKPPAAEPLIFDGQTAPISTLMLTPKLDELEKVAPFVPLGPVRD